MLGFQPFLGAVLAALVDASLVSSVPACPIEQMDGAEALHWRLRLHSLVRQGRPSEAARIAEALVGEDCSAHWMRSCLAREVRRLRLRDPQTRSALDTTRFTLHEPGAVPLGGDDLERWALDRLPYVSPAQLLLCSSHARSQGRWEDALAWSREALRTSPITDHSFFTTTLTIVSAARNSAASVPAARSLLEELTGARWFGAEDLQWFEAELTSFLRARPGAEAEAAGERLLSRCHGGRFALAVRLRLASPSYSARGSQDAWHQDFECLAAACELGLDAAAVMHRLSTLDLLQPSRWERGEAALRQSYTLAPEGLLRQRIAGDLMVHWAHRGGHADELRGLFEERFGGSAAAAAPLLAATEVSLQFLRERGERELARDIAHRLLDRMPAHPFRATLYFTLAELESDPTRARELLEACLRVASLADDSSSPPQMEALASLSERYERDGHAARAADRLGHWLALRDLPERDLAPRAASFAHLFDLQLRSGRDRDRVIEDLLLVIDDGRCLGRDDRERTLGTLMSAFTGADRRRLAERLLEQRRRRESEGLSPQTEQALRTAEQVARHPELFASLCEEWTEAPGDEALYALAQRAFELEARGLALELLRRGERHPPADGSRYGQAPPEALARELVRWMPRLEGRDERLVGRLLRLHPVRAARPALLARIADPRRPAPDEALVLALDAHLDAGAEPLDGEEEALAESLFRRLESGDLQVVRPCLRLDGRRTAEALLHAEEQTSFHGAAIRVLSNHPPELCLPPLTECVRREPRWLERAPVRETLRHLRARQEQPADPGDGPRRP